MLQKFELKIATDIEWLIARSYRHWFFYPHTKYNFCQLPSWTSIKENAVVNGQQKRMSQTFLDNTILKLLIIIMIIFGKLTLTLIMNIWHGAKLHKSTQVYCKIKPNLIFIYWHIIIIPWGSKFAYFWCWLHHNEDLITLVQLPDVKPFQSVICYFPYNLLWNLNYNFV